MSEMVSEEPSGKAAADKKEAKKSSEGKKSSNDTSKVRLFFFFLLAPIWFGLCLTSSYLSVLQVVIRRLPPTMTEAVFVEQVGPFPPHDYFYFVEADKSLEPHNFSRSVKSWFCPLKKPNHYAPLNRIRAYVNFTNREDIFLFTERFDGYVFVDEKGNEYPAMVELAPYQKVSL